MKINKKPMALFFALITSAAMAQAADAKLDTNLTLIYDNSVSLAESNRDIFSDEILSLNLVASKSFMLNQHSNLSVKAKLARNQFARFDDLSNTDLALGARYRIQPKIGFYQPWLELGANAEKQEFDDSDIRDGALLSLNVSAHKRFTERLNAHVGIGAEKRSADSGDVFEWNRYSVFVSGQYRWSESSTLSANYRLQTGDQIFVGTASPAFLISANATADDPIFGNRRAYRLDAHANIFNASLNYRINSNNTLDAGLHHTKIQAEASHEYDATQVHLSWLHRF